MYGTKYEEVRTSTPMQANAFLSANTVARNACGMPVVESTRARHDKLLRDLDHQARIFRELLDELRELNGSAS